MTTADNPENSLPELVAACRESAARVLAKLPEKPQVAVIEDDAGIARTYVRVLAELADVTVFGSGAELVKALQSKCFDLIISDTVGLGSVDKIKQMAPDLSVVVISGSSEPAKLPSGVALWVTKPVPLPELVALVERELDVFGVALK